MSFLITAVLVIGISVCNGLVLNRMSNCADERSQARTQGFALQSIRMRDDSDAYFWGSRSGRI